MHFRLKTIWPNIIYILFFSCNSSSKCGNVGLSVCLSVGWCQQVSRSMKCLKDALNHNVTMLYVLRITLSAYCTLCKVLKIMFMHYAYDAKNTSSRNHDMK